MLCTKMYIKVQKSAKIQKSMDYSIVLDSKNGLFVRLLRAPLA